jgi:hypothetical protein
MSITASQLSRYSSPDGSIRASDLFNTKFSSHLGEPLVQPKALDSPADIFGKMATGENEAPWRTWDTNKYKSWLERRNRIVYDVLHGKRKGYPGFGEYTNNARSYWKSLDHGMRLNLIYSNIADDKLADIVFQVVAPKVRDDVNSYISEQGGIGKVRMVASDPSGGWTPLKYIPGLGRFFEPAPKVVKARATVELAKLFGDYSEDFFEHALNAPKRALSHFTRAFKEIDKSHKTSENAPAFTKAAIQSAFNGEFIKAWRKTTKGADTFGDVVAESSGFKRGSKPFMTVAFAANFAGDTAVDPIQWLLALGGGELVGLTSKVSESGRTAITEATAMDKILSSRGTTKFLKEALGKPSGFVSDLVERNGAYLDPEDLIGLSRAKNLDEARSVLKDAWASGRMRGIPQLNAKLVTNALPTVPLSGSMDLKDLGRILPKEQLNLFDPQVDRELRRAFQAFGHDEARVNELVTEALEHRQANRLEDSIETVRKGMREPILAKTGWDDDVLDGVLQDVAADGNRAFNSLLPIGKRVRTGNIPAGQVFGVVPAEAGDAVKVFNSKQLLSQSDYTLAIPRPRDVKRLIRALDEGPTAWAREGVTSANDVARKIMGRWSVWKLAAPAWLAKVSSDEFMMLSGRFGFSNMLREFWRQGAYEITALKDAERAAEMFPDLAEMVYHPTISARHVPGVLGSVPDEVSAAYRNLARAAEKSGQGINDYLELAPTHPMHVAGWFRTTAWQLPSDPVARLFLQHPDEPERAAQLAREFLNTGDGKYWLAHTGRELTEIPAVQGGLFELPAEVAPKVVNEAVETVRKMVDYQYPGKLRRIASLRPVTVRDLHAIPVAERPVTWGPGLAPEFFGEIGKTTWKAMSAFVDEPATKLVSRFLDKMGWVSNITRKAGWNAAVEQRSTEILKVFEQAGKNVANEGVVAEAQRLATEYAARQIPRFIHNPAERTVFDEAVRGIMPFTFAKVQFVKRYARLWATRPGYVRGLQIMTGAMADSGWITKDDNGNMVFEIPVMPQFVSWAMQRFTGLPGLGSVVSRFIVAHDENADDSWKGHLTRNFDALGHLIVPKYLPFGQDMVPTVGPTITFPLEALAAARPSWKRVYQSIFGAQSSGFKPEKGYVNSLLDMVGRSWMHDASRGLKGIFTGDDGDRLYANSVIDVLSWMAYKGLDPNKKENQEKAHNVAGLLFLVRGLDKFFAPYSVPPNMPGSEMVAKLQEWREQYGPQEALDKFITAYGVNAAYFAGSKSKFNEHYYPTTKAGAEFYRKNKDLYERFPDVAGLFAEDGSVGEAFDYNAYVGQLADHTREALSPSDAVTSTNVKLGNKVYYEILWPRYDKMREQGYTADDLSDWLHEAQRRVNERFPGWLDYHNGWSKRSADRQQSIDELRGAIAHPTVANTETAKALRVWYAAYDRALSIAQEAGYTTLRSDNLDDLRAWLANVAHQIANKSKSTGFKSAYEYMFRGEIEGYGHQEDEAA